LLEYQNHGAKGLKDLSEFKDEYIFKYEDTGKLLLSYCENQEPLEVTDYLGNKYLVTDKSGCCLVPTTYELGKALDYIELIEEKSSERAIYKE
jgi:hypothetical protein